MPPPSVILVGVFSSSQRYSSLCEATRSQASSLLLPLPGRCCHLPGGIFFVLQAAPEFRSLVPASPCLVSLQTGSGPCLVSLLTGSCPCTQAPSASLLLAASSSSSLPQDLLPPGTPVCPLSSPSVDWLALGQAIDYNGLLQVGEASAFRRTTLTENARTEFIPKTHGGQHIACNSSPEGSHTCGFLWRYVHNPCPPVKNNKIIF